MRLKKLRFGKGFRVVPCNRRSQAAEMVIAPGERHEIKNTGRGLLRTLNFYVPPAYAKSGDPLSHGRR